MTSPLSAGAALAAGSAAPGRALADPAPLTDGSWSVVLRCADPAGGTVVVKRYPPRDSGPGSFAAEAAALALSGPAGTGAAGFGPRLLAADPGTLTVVMSDLGTGPSLADLLLDGQPAAAGAALLDWADGLGRLAVAAADRAAEHARLLERYRDGTPQEAGEAGLRDRAEGLAGRAALLGVTSPAGLAAELAPVADLVAADRHLVFSPGDQCPDNNLLTPDGLRFLDFENAGYHSVFLDAAYLRMPFSTCWCVFALPAALAARAESAYRAQVARVHADLAADDVWEPGVRRAVVGWTLRSMGWLLDGALEGDTSLHSERVAPGRRQLIRHRWRVLGGLLDAAGELPKLAGLVSDLLAATEHWRAPELGRYPALADWRAPVDPAPVDRAPGRDAR